MIVSDEEFLAQLIQRQIENPEDKYLPREIEMITKTIDNYRNMYLTFYGTIEGVQVHFKFKAFHLRDMLFYSEPERKDYIKEHWLKIPLFTDEILRLIISNSEDYKPTRIAGLGYEVLVDPPVSK